MKNTRKSKVLISGGLSFIGSNFIELLLNSSRFKILNIDKISYSSVYKFKKNIPSKSYSFIKCDISNEKKLSVILNSFRPDFIINFASESHVDRSIDKPDDFLKSNLIGVYNFLEIIRKNKIFLKKIKFVQISTDEVYGSISKGSFNEKSPLNPSSPYSTTKASAELFVKSWSSLYNINSVIINCVNNFGPHQFPEKLIPLSVLKFLRNEKVDIYGNGKNKREWIFVEDFCKSIFNISFSKNKNKQYCVTSEFEITNIELVKYIYSRMTNNSNPKYKNFINYVKDRPAHDKRYSLNNELYKKEFKSKKMNNKDFFAKLDYTIEWYKENISKIKSYKDYSGNRIGIIKK